MLLNLFGQPTLIRRENTYLCIEELKESPLLLCHKNSLMGKLLPEDWSGCLCASANILDDIKRKHYKITNQNYLQKMLMENETVDIPLNSKARGRLNLDKHIQLTMIPLDKDNFMYTIKDNYVTNLLTDNLTENMDAFVSNKHLRQCIKDGVDVLYLNDGVYSKSSQLSIYPTEYLLRALVTLVQPRYVIGVWGNELPKYVEDCRRPIDYYTGSTVKFAPESVIANLIVLNLPSELRRK